MLNYPPLSQLTEEQIQRYSRHIILADVGGAGQQKILNSKVLIIGAGGLGSPAALYLAAAGVGRIGIADADVVDMTNLQRQVIHHTPDVNKAKVVSAKEKIAQINPDVKVQDHQVQVGASNIAKLISNYDFVIDGVDNFPTKFLINDACVMNKKAYSHAGILRFDGQLFTYNPREEDGGCYRCIFAEPPPQDAVPSCSQAGVLGVLGGVVGSLQATEALKYILGKGDLLVNRLLVYNALEMKFRKVKFRKNPSCPVCGSSPVITELVDGGIPLCDLKG